MQTVTLSSTRRDGIGKELAKKIRQKGHIPAILYGHGLDANVALTLDPIELNKALRTAWGTNVLIDLQVEGGGGHSVLAREIQRHPVSRAIIHVDFVAPNPEKEVTVYVPLNVTGRSIGVQAGGKLRTPYREVRLRAKPSLIPADVEVDITALDQGDTIMASGLQLAEGVSAVYDRDYVVAKIVAPRGVKADETDEKAKKK